MGQPVFTTKPSSVYHILIVDDDRAGPLVLGQAMKNLQRRHQLHFVWDGAEALDFLHGRGEYRDAPRPHLVLLDINMPRLGGLATLSAIKSDPYLHAIPVVMLSTSNAPQDVRESYHAHANGYIQKPANLDSIEKLVQAVESFWMEFVLLPEIPPRVGKKRQRSSKAGCEMYKALLDEFGASVRELIQLHEQQFQSIVEDESDCHRFDLLIHMANEKKQLAKYACLRHVEEHGC